MFENTYTCLLQLPKNQTRQENIVDLQLEMVWSLHFLGQQDRALKICKQIESVANDLKDPVRICRVDHAYGLTYFFINQYAQTERYFLKILQHSQKSEMDELIQAVKFALATNYLSIGHWKEAADLYSEVIYILETRGNQGVYFEDSPFLAYPHMCHHLGYIRALQGHVNETKKLIQKGYTPALEQLCNLQSRAYCCLWHSAISALIGEDYGALDRVNKVLEIAEETDSPIICYLCYAAKGNALIATEQFKAAKEILKKSLLCIEGTTHRRYLEAVYYNLVRVSLELGDWDEAERYYQDALPLVKLNPDRESSRFDFLKGRLLTSSDSPDFGNARLFFEKSIQADETSGAVVQAAQTKYYLAQMLAQEGEIERSRDILSDIRDMFENWVIPFWQSKCNQALDTINQGK
jgi:tetratricopeptide (TPR) repeat protein